MSRHILMIAYHYPPILHSSGVHRTAKFVQYLPEHGWHPDVLTVHPRAYVNTAPVLEPAAPNTTVTRAFALDTARHLSIKGRYFKTMALPDRWISWCIGAIPSGLRLIRKHRPDIIWSTYPIASAHLIGYWLHKLSGIPWIADFRDPMTDDDHPSDTQTRQAYQRIEARTMAHCSHAVFTTTDTQQLYLQRFADKPRDTLHVIPNGFDEDTFVRAEQNAAPQLARSRPEQLYFVHAGILYPSERNPIPFFHALSELKQSGFINPGVLKIVLRASGNDGEYRQKLSELGIANIVFLEPSLPYEQVLGEMLHADGLLLFQAANCNHQIPAKAYEYIRARRPIFTLTDPQGNTAKLLQQCGFDNIVNLEDKEQIKSGLMDFIGKVHSRSAPIAADATIESFSRRHRTRELVEILNRCVK